MLYFAYGSNMNWAQIKGRCPSARFFSIAKLKDHRLAFTRKSERRGCGSADVVPHQGSRVWGVIYEIDERDVAWLDEAEDYVPGRPENGYTRRRGLVYRVGEEEPVTVSLYLAEKEENPPLPGPEYKRLIVDGAKHWRLPPDYIAELERIEVAS